MKLVIDKDDKGNWRWLLVTVKGMSVTVHDSGQAGGPAEAFRAGWDVAVAKYNAPAIDWPVPCSHIGT